MSGGKRAYRPKPTAQAIKNSDKSDLQLCTIELVVRLGSEAASCLDHHRNSDIIDETFSDRDIDNSIGMSNDPAEHLLDRLLQNSSSDAVSRLSPMPREEEGYSAVYRITAVELTGSDIKHLLNLVPRYRSDFVADELPDIMEVNIFDGHRNSLSKLMDSSSYYDVFELG